MSNEFVEVVMCPNCQQAMAYDCQASDGDGDIYDLWVCRLCGHQEQRNVRWVSPMGDVYWGEWDWWLMPVSGETKRMFWNGFFFDIDFIEFADGTVTAEAVPVEIGCANDPELDDIPF